MTVIQPQYHMIAILSMNLWEFVKNTESESLVKALLSYSSLIVLW